MSFEIRSLEIRVAASTDADAACTVLRRSITECCDLDHKNDPAILDAWLGNKTPQMVANWFSSPTNFSLVALNEGLVVGVALLTGAGKLALCYLLPEARGQGVGKALLARMEEQACSWGVKALQLHSTATGQEFFARRGYVDAGKVRSPYGVETVFFWKQLDAGAEAPDGSKRKRFCNCNPV
ncbi:putative acetyltransferase, GNAT family [Janthinobacterium sp. HH01]|uniref:GNAT family N-acetyltransferase n=1 Tax=Janthinobacterium sp. HH01 TaxID=1198452 RepID=UPI0002AEB0A9|nr:GNAT family N-acetyltransferase [Janthinobacterium sp. HH01]ELX09241.1 putative acetyltransferase, GNAT family [Janthinobacterium sp. HH01]